VITPSRDAVQIVGGEKIVKDNTAGGIVVGEFTNGRSTAKFQKKQLGEEGGNVG